MSAVPRSTRVAAALLAALLFAPRNAHAENAMEVARVKEEFIRAHGDQPIVAVDVEGLRRTRAVVVWQWIDCSVGEPLSRCDLPAIRDRLYHLAIFSDIEVALDERPEGVGIVFRLTEKWTLYPVPMLWYSPGTQLAGLILVEANLLGYNKGVALGGVYSNRGWYALAGYSDPNIAFSNLWGSMRGFVGSGIVENDAPDGTIKQSFDMTRFDLEYSLGWTFFNRVSPVWTGALRTANVGTVHVPGAEPATNGTVALQGLQLIYSDRRYRDLYDAGLRLSAEVQHAFPLTPTTRAYDDAIFDAKWARAAPLDGFVDVHARAFVGSLPIVFEERLGGLDGSRTLPGTGLVGADRYASLSLDYQVPFLKLALGTATGGMFGEVGRYARNEEPAVSYGGPGAGLRFFLKKVAVPAVGVDVGYEAWASRVRFSVSVGYRPVR
jgi:hypothetical protein